MGTQLFSDFLGSVTAIDRARVAEQREGHPDRSVYLRAIDPRRETEAGSLPRRYLSLWHERLWGWSAAVLSFREQGTGPEWTAVLTENMEWTRRKRDGVGRPVLFCGTLPDLLGRILERVRHLASTGISGDSLDMMMACAALVLDVLAVSDPAAAADEIALLALADPATAVVVGNSRDRPIAAQLTESRQPSTLKREHI